jgi:hypothetical protein
LEDVTDLLLIGFRRPGGAGGGGAATVAEVVDAGVGVGALFEGAGDCEPEHDATAALIITIRTTREIRCSETVNDVSSLFWNLGGYRRDDGARLVAGLCVAGLHIDDDVAARRQGPLAGAAGEVCLQGRPAVGGLRVCEGPR